MTITPTRHTNQLRKFSGLPTELALRRGAAFLSYLVDDPDFVDSLSMSLLEDAGRAEDWYVAHRCDAEDGSFSLQVFVWPPGTSTKIHDHASWGPTVAPSGPCSRSATSASTTEPPPYCPRTGASTG